MLKSYIINGRGYTDSQLKMFFRLLLPDLNSGNIATPK